MKYGLNKINIRLFRQQVGGSVVKELNSILGVQGLNFTTCIVVNIGILIEYFAPTYLSRLGGYLSKPK
jgi:hypothetical protein